MEYVYPEEILRKGGPWLGAVRNRIKWIRCSGNGESITWGSNEALQPPLTMKEVEQLASEAAAAAYNDSLAKIEQLEADNEKLRGHLNKRLVLEFNEQVEFDILKDGLTTIADGSACDVRPDRVWDGQHHCATHGVWFRDEDEEAHRCPVAEMAEAVMEAGSR